MLSPKVFLKSVCSIQSTYAVTAGSMISDPQQNLPSVQRTQTWTSMALSAQMSSSVESDCYAKQLAALHLFPAFYFCLTADSHSVEKCVKRLPGHRLQLQIWKNPADCPAKLKPIFSLWWIFPRWILEVEFRIYFSVLCRMPLTHPLHIWTGGNLDDGYKCMTLAHPLTFAEGKVNSVSM